jgi:hypothetical protein
MDINKAIRKQDKSHKRFLLSMSFIFFILPLILVLSNRINLFFLIYLCIIELLILIAFFINISSNYLRYNTDNYKLRIKLRKFGEEFNIVYDKVAFVHTQSSGIKFEIILIMSSKFRNKKIKPIDEDFIKKYTYVAQQYYKLKKLRPEENFFYLTINKGGFHKYRLLDLIYRNCVHAHYTEEAVERIKEYRN